MKTEIIKAAYSKAVTKAAAVLERGGIIIYPTETLYGIGADASDDKAVKKVLDIKKRPASKHVLVAFSDIKMAKKYLVITKKTELLAKAFMPGPLSLIVETKQQKRKVGFRIPDNKFVLSLIRKLGRPITSTSANISGKENMRSVKSIIKTFSGKVNLIIDGGSMKKGRASTVYDMAEGKVVREGPISEKQIRDALNG